jgi:hypothetical protein
VTSTNVDIPINDDRPRWLSQRYCTRRGRKRAARYHRAAVLYTSTACPSGPSPILCPLPTPLEKHVGKTSAQ